MTESVENLASYRRCTARIGDSWQAFRDRREQRLRERERFGHAAERAAESVVEDLFTMVLDWSLGDVNHQVGYADILLTRLGLKHVIVETKRPGALAWNLRAVERALEQARGYAAAQKVRCVAVSDGVMLYAADVSQGGLEDRVFCSLEAAEPPLDLWWLSVDGIYRRRRVPGEAVPRLLPEAQMLEPASTAPSAESLLHPKYRLPVDCFAYAGDAGDPRTWHLPYLNADGTVDARRLPKAIQAILTNYRGARLSSVPESAIPDVLVRLARAAGSLGRLPHQAPEAAPVYVQLVAVLEQLDRLEEVTKGGEAASGGFLAISVVDAPMDQDSGHRANPDHPAAEVQT